MIGRTNPRMRLPGKFPGLRGIAPLLWILLAISYWLVQPSTASAQVDESIYTDALTNGWQNWSWATVNLSNTAPVYSGTASISVNAGAYQALYLHHDAFDSTLYTGLSFYINGGSAGGQVLQVQAELNGTAQTVVTIPALAANTWQQVNIPLKSLGVQNQPNLDGFWIQNPTASTLPTFYVDSMSLLAGPAPSVVNVTVNAAQALRVVDARQFAINAAVWDGVFDTAATIGLLTEMGNQALRFPGGSLSDDYHWATNTTDANTWTWATSFDNFGQVATVTGAQVFITANYGSGTPAEAAAWVTASNVTSQYGFKYWEIGNEVYGSWETDNNVRPHDPYTYAQRFQNYYNQMKAADPTIKVGAVAVPGEDSYANYTDHPATNPVTGVSHNGWTPVMLATLRSLGVTPDFLIYHRYSESPGAEFDQELLLSSGSWATDAADLREQLTDYLGAGAAAGVELDCTENNSVSSNPGKQTTSLVNGLFRADSLCAAMQTEFNTVAWWDLRNGQDTGNNNSSTLYGWRLYGDYGVVDSANPPGPADRYPDFYVSKLLQYFARGGDQLIGATSDYPLLSVCAAARTNGSLTLLVINKSASNPLNANIVISGVTPATTGYVYSYGIAQDNAAESGTGSADVAANPATGLAANLSWTFQPYSASVIAFGAGPSASPTASATPTTTATATAAATATTTPTRTATPTATPTAAISVPASLALGSSPVGDTVTKNLTVKNTGKAPLNIASASSSGAEFVPTGACVPSGTVAPATSCTIAIAFTPSALGAPSATLTLTDNAGTGSQNVSLSGTGTIDMTVTPTSDAFARVKLGSRATKTITIHNYQTSPVSLSEGFGGPNAGDFSVTGGTCTGTLAAKTACSIVVTFARTAAGAESAAMTVTDSPDPLGPYTVSFSAAETIPGKVSPAALAFGTVTLTKSKTKNVTVTNLASVPITLSESAPVGANAGDFSVASVGTCAASSVCTIPVTFTPSTQTAESASLTVSIAEDPTSPHNVNLTGTGR